jgi:hypothetical protein
MSAAGALGGRRRSRAMRRLIALAALVALGVCRDTPAQAQFTRVPVDFSALDLYAGGSVGIGSSRMHSTHDPALEARIYPYAVKYPTSVFGQAYAGVGWRFLAIEGGWLTLPHYHGYAVGTNPPRSGSQDIDGQAIFGRLLVRTPPSWTWWARPYLFAGAAQVWSQNHEVGSCPTCGAGYIPDFRISFHATRPYFGGGVDVPLISHLSARAELGIIPDAVDSFWTGDRDYTFGSIGLMWRF